MKKLLPLLLLSLSFSVHALSLIEVAPCESGDLNKAVEKLRMELDEETNEEDEAFLISFLEDFVRDSDVEFGFYECMESPQGQLVNGVRNGLWTWYNKFNQKTKEGNYANGKKEGKWTEWIYKSFDYHSGYDTIHMNYKNDELDGKWTHWFSSEGTWGNWVHSNEVMLLEGILKRYKFEENQTKINEVTAQLNRLEMPRIIEEGNYINGKKEGTWTFRNSTGNYTNGKKDGTWTFLSSAGISEEEVYEDGELKYININD